RQSTRSFASTGIASRSTCLRSISRGTADRHSRRPCAASLRLLDPDRAAARQPLDATSAEELRGREITSARRAYKQRTDRHQDTVDREAVAVGGGQPRRAHVASVVSRLSPHPCLFGIALLLRRPRIIPRG